MSIPIIGPSPGDSTRPADSLGRRRSNPTYRADYLDLIIKDNDSELRFVKRSRDYSVTIIGPSGLALSVNVPRDMEKKISNFIKLGLAHDYHDAHSIYKKSKYSYWSDAEKQALMDPNICAKDLAKKIGRSLVSVLGARKYYGIKSNAVPKTYVHWQPEHIAMLKDESLTNSQIAELTGRTYESVCSYRTKFGFARRGKMIPKEKGGLI